ncbi:MAG: ABC transporter ATP-binding protein [Asticcacaulis sp.]
MTMDLETPLLEAKALTYAPRGKAPHSVEAVSLSLHPGQMLALCGPNGAGKSSLIRLMCGLERPRSGTAKLEGRPVRAWSAPERASRLGYLPQQRRIAWGLSVADIVALGIPPSTRDPHRERVEAALERVNLGHKARESVLDLSGGEQARVLLARLWATGARTLVLDEPVEGLDPRTQLVVLDGLRRHADAGGVVLVALHDLRLAARYATDIAVLSEGRLVRSGAPQKALDGETLSRVFGVEGVWSQTPHGPELSLYPQDPEDR